MTRDRFGFKRPLESYPPLFDKEGKEFSIKGYKSGSIEYQNALLESVLYKLANKVELNPMEETFIDVQGDFCNYPLREMVERIKGEERGWLTKAIINKIKNRKLNKKRSEIEELKLDIEKAKLKKELENVKKS